MGATGKREREKEKEVVIRVEKQTYDRKYAELLCLRKSGIFSISEERPWFTNFWRNNSHFRF
jgi:hypothetical protein